MAKPPKTRPDSGIKKEVQDMFFGRRYGRPMRKDKRAALEEHLPALKCNPETVCAHIKAAQDQGQDIWLEIGCGNGEYLFEMLKHYPDHYFIACEPFMNGVGHFCKMLGQAYEDGSLSRADVEKRLRFWCDSAELLLAAMPDACMDRIYLLNPDPWPKSRHHKRRFIQDQSVETLCRVLKDDADFITATDVAELAEWMFEHVIRNPNMVWQGESRKSWETQPDDWMTTTRYAQKGAEEGRTEIYLLFKRKGRG